MELDQVAEVMMSHVLEALELSVTDVPLLEAFWDGVGVCQVSLAGMGLLYQMLDEGNVELQSLPLQLEGNTTALGSGPAAHRTLIAAVRQFLASRGIATDEIKVEALEAGTRADLAIPSMSVLVECGNTRPEKTLHVLSLGKTQWIIPYPDSCNRTTVYEFRPVTSFSTIGIEPLTALRPHRPIGAPATLLNEEDIHRLLDTFSKKSRIGLRNRCIVLVLARVGLKSSELLALRPSHIDFRSSTVSVPAVGSYPKPRQVNIPEDIRELLSRWADVRPKADTFFCTIQGEPVLDGYLRNMLLRHGQAAQISGRVGPEVLRQSCAKWYIERGTDLQDLRAYLGMSLGTLIAIRAQLDF